MQCSVSSFPQWYMNYSRLHRCSPLNLWFIHGAVTMTPNIKFESSNLELLTLCSSQTCKCLHSNYQGLIFDLLIY